MAIVKWYVVCATIYGPRKFGPFSNRVQAEFKAAALNSWNKVIPGTVKVFSV